MAHSRRCVIAFVAVLVGNAAQADVLVRPPFDLAVVRRELESARLPVARAAKALPRPLPPVLRISGNSIFVDAKFVQKTDVFARTGEWHAEKLEAKLAAARRRAGDTIVFAVEPEIPYRIVKKAHFHANKAGFMSVMFAVRTADSPDVMQIDMRQGDDDGRAYIPKYIPEVLLDGSLDAQLIDAVIKKKLAPMTLCYDREIAKSPGLGGRLVVSFTIGPDGKVRQSSVKSSTMGSPTVEACVAAQFEDLVFPKPKGGGIVNVNYPLLFSPSDGE